MPSRSSSLLVVEDTVNIRLIVQIALERAGYTVTSVGTGSAAMQALATTPYALLLTDLHLPDMDGTDLIRQAQRLPDCPAVLVMSGTAWEDGLGRDATLHDVAFLAKPFLFDDLLAAVAHALMPVRCAA